ncbi:MAG: ribonucleotide reductase N-terminal alpha domain-containing protein [Pseudomonadota bacterium]
MKIALSQRAVEILESRYLLRDIHQRQIVETPMELFHRVAKAVAKAEQKFGGKKQRSFWESKFLQSLSDLEFLPNSPTLMNAGTEMGQLSA